MPDRAPDHADNKLDASFYTEDEFDALARRRYPAVRAVNNL
jgi:hypothetical protein